jgi:hypothetical protein
MVTLPSRPDAVPPPPLEPSVFGFEVRSDQSLRFLRSGGGVSTLDIVTAPEARTRPAVAPIADWMMAGTEYQARATLYRVDRGYEFWATDAGAYHIDPDRGRIEIPQTDDEIAREQRLWGIPAMLCYMHRDDLPLHAAAIELKAGAVLLAAPSRFGKTTLAYAFHRNGYRVLSEDLTCWRLDPSPELLPGPAVLRIRTDVYEGCPPAGTHVVVTRPDRVFLGLDDGRKGSSAPVPIGGIVFLRESTDGLRMERAEPSVAMADLWALNFRLQTSEGRARSFRQLGRLVKSVPVWNLYRPFRLDSLDATVARVAAEFDRCGA